ncbi:unnamed protein product [Sphagnum compactum]
MKEEEQEEEKEEEEETEEARNVDGEQLVKKGSSLRFVSVQDKANLGRRMSSNQWRERAGGFFSSSSAKLKQATAVAGEVAKTAGSSVADAAERAGSVVRSSWSLLQQQQQQQQQHGGSKEGGGGHAIHDRWQSASSAFKKTREKVALGLQDTKEKVVIGLSDTKEKVAIGTVKAVEIAKKATVRSRVLIAKMDWWQKGKCCLLLFLFGSVFRVPLEVLVEKQNSARPIPLIVIRCVDYLVKSGLHAEYLFKQEGDPLVIHHLVSLYNEDWNATLPDGVNPIDVAALLKLYLCMLPAPLLTFELYDDIIDARGSDSLLRQCLTNLPAANYYTIECLSALLLRISQKSALNKMDAHSLAIELSPALLWRKSKVSPLESPKKESEPKQTVPAMSLRRFSGDMLLNGDTEDEKSTDMSAQIPLDDEPVSVNFAVVEAVQCLIEQHDVIFANTVKAVWHELGS